MPMCIVCGEAMPDGTRTCRECGSAMPDFVPAAGDGASPVKRRSAVATAPVKLPPGGRFCTGCSMVYAADYTDAYCICGAELAGAPPEAAEVPAPHEPEPVVEQHADRPPAGTHCLVLYGPDRQPLHWFALAKDATMIGRLDAPGGNFPDIDIDEWLDAGTARRISRQHALVLRSRVTGDFALRPLPGNTGTQVEADMVMPMIDYPLAPGQRLILGGVARFKFEVA
jgi:hypothetical protein